MANEPQEHPPPAVSHFVPRKQEMQALADLLPIKGVNVDSNRVFNIWGEDGVGKSAFLSEFRVSELMAKEKVLWLQPTREDSLDTIPEFIEACAKTIRYPSAPQKEKKIASLLESAQRGKINPVVSDDSLLITRSTVARNKKRYVNQAAAASVGRTEMARDEIEINVGLEGSKATNHAEGFLDALPLQSLGTDLTLIYIEHFNRLSATIVDWLRDYVFPAASRGPYRRSLAFLFESTEPIAFAYPNESWGEWAELKADYRLYPLSDDDVRELCAYRKIDEADAAFVRRRSLGYPQRAAQAIATLKSLDRTSACRFLDGLTRADQIKVAALSLLDRLYPDELDTLFGSNQGRELFDWFRQLPDNHATSSPSGKSLTLSDSLRAEALSRFHKNTAWLDYARKAEPLAKLLIAVPAKSVRSKLLLLSGLQWIDLSLCDQLFGEQAVKITPFITDSPQYFTRIQERYRLTERLRDVTQEVAQSMRHPGMEIVAKKAKALWDVSAQAALSEIAAIEAKIEAIEGELAGLQRKQSETSAQIRIQERTTEDGKEPSEKPRSRPKWLRFSSHSAKEGRSTLGLRQLSHELSQKINELENQIDELRATLSGAKSALRYPFA